MKVAAYVLAADPEWLRESVRSYYPLVSRIVVSYDRDHLSWTGQPLDIEACIAVLKTLDTENKASYVPGHFWHPDAEPLQNDTAQRQAALDAASEGADWVLQLDTDEILLNASAFSGALTAAEEAGRDGLEYPARLMYTSLGRGRYLELSRRFGQIAANYPGPVAVRAGTHLRLCRQGIAWERLWRADFRRRNTDPLHPRSVHVDAVVSPADAILHLSWVRSPEGISAKVRSSGHTREFDHDLAIATWQWRTRHPLRTALTTPLRKRGRIDWLRISRVNPQFDGWSLPDQPSMG